MDDNTESGRTFVFDLELAGDASTVTVYEQGAPRLKQTMTYAEIEQLLDQVVTPQMAGRPV